MQHLIRQQLLELHVKSKQLFAPGLSQQQLGLQEKLNGFFHQDLLPVLEKWFDELTLDDSTLYIDRLVLDLGAFNAKEFTGESLKERLMAQLSSPAFQHTVYTAIAASATATDTPFFKNQSINKSPRSFYNRQENPFHPKADSPLLIQRHSAGHNAFHQWLFYMEKGYLPWNRLQIDPAWKDKVLETLAIDYEAISLLRKILPEQPITLRRITLQQDEIFLTKLTEILTAVSQTLLPQLIKELQELLKFASTTLPFPTTQTIWQEILLLAAATGNEGKESTPEKLTTRLLQRYWNEPPTEEQQKLQNYLTTHPLAQTLLSPSTTQKSDSQLPDRSHPIQHHIPSIPNDPKTPNQQLTSTPTTPPTREGARPLTKTSSDTPSPTSQNQNSTTLSPEANTTPLQTTTDITQKPITTTTTPTTPISPKTNNTQKTTDTPPNTLTTDELPEEGLFVLNAGVILIHPFLNPLFKTTNLLEKGKFIDITAQQHAIHLIHYIATHRTIAEEHELVIPKILCGCPLEIPMETTIPFKNNELEEADNLLEALISHWGVKNITTEGLRGNFLTRSGKLSPKAENLHLVIEKHAVDILIRTYPLPWNMNIIRLPWLKQTIHLDW